VSEHGYEMSASEISSSSTSFFHRFSGLLKHVTIIIPEAQRRFVPRMLVAQDAQRRRGQDKIPRGPGGQAQPAGGEYAQHVAVTEDHDGCGPQ
jgi:hypothetical protein